MSGNSFIYCEEGNPKARISPDTYVVSGVLQRARPSYKVWENAGRVPAIVFEFTSRKTRADDLIRKRRIYEEKLKVPEYILLDPTGDYLQPRRKGLRLVNGLYEGIPLVNGRLYSEQLEVEPFAEGSTLRFFDPKTQRILPTHAESEAEIVRLRAENEVLRNLLSRRNGG